MSDPLKEPIFIMHTIFISCIGYIILYNVYYMKSLWLYFFGIGKLNFFAEIPILSPILRWFFFIIYRFAIYMLIIIFVPFVIIFPIPIFPFVFILPLKPLMLLLIPPFKTLTDLGT